MAEIDFDHYGGETQDYSPNSGLNGQSIFNIAGAICSIGLTIGLVVWGYQIAMRDVSGIPVLRAAQADLRVAPEEQGGEKVAHQGLTVNAVAAVGAVASMPETVQLAPPPTGLAEEDAAGLGALISAEPLPEMPGALDQTVSRDALALEPIESLTSPVVGVDVVATNAEAFPQDQSAAVDAALAAALGEESPIVLSSPRPRGRQAVSVDAVTELNGLAAVENVAAVQDIAPETIAPGTVLAQIGAFDDRETAADAWLAMRGRFGELMSEKSMVIQEASSGGQAFYRLRALGFTDEDDARRFCAALLAEGANCLPVAQR